MELDLKHDCKPLMERINVFKAAFSENEDNERYWQQQNTHTQSEGTLLTDLRFISLMLSAASW